MIKKSIFQILNGFRILSFWVFVALLVVSIMSAVRESKVNITVEDAVLGYKINEYAGIQEFNCVCDGKSITVHDTKGRKTGDEVQLIFRDGEYYALVNPEFPDNGVTLKDRVSYRFNMATGGNLIFTLIAYIILFIVTFKSRKESWEEYPKLHIITHVFGVVSVVLFVLWCFWLDFLNLIVYAVIFAIIWIIRVIIHSVSIYKRRGGTHG